MWIDTHAHLSAFDENTYFAQLKRAKDAGIHAVINVGTNMEESRIAAERAKLKAPVKTFAAVGICVPESGNYVGDFAWADELSELAKSPEVVAIGETGLDGAGKGGYPSKEVQAVTFKKQIELAKTIKKPLIVHSRMQDEEALDLCASAGIKKALFHCFTGTAEAAKKIVNAGYYISFSGIATFAKSGLDDAIRAVPSDRLLIETDSPWLSPVPFRGKQNEPANLRFVAEKVAQVRGIEEDELAENIKDNAQNFFEVMF